MEPNIIAFLSFSLLSLVASVHCYGEKSFKFKPMGQFIREELSKMGSFDSSPTGLANSLPMPAYIGPQDGLKERDVIQSLPGQPDGVDFAQYSGYVTVDPSAGRALFYYFAVSPQNSSTKPLVLWLNGGCSSFGHGAMMELGPFRVNKNGQTLYRNEHSWNNDANILFLESPAGVGFSYSNTTSDYKLRGDNSTAQDSYTFLVNWLERFPEYKTRNFYIAGENYAGHFVPQLAQTILHNNKKYTNQTIINLKGIAIGNALIDVETHFKGIVDYFWTHALISDELYRGIVLNCNYSSSFLSQICFTYLDQADNVTANIYPYNIYAPWCNSSSDSIPMSSFDPCSEAYVKSYLNMPQVQIALHANVTALPYPWKACSDVIYWKDRPSSVLPVIQELMESGVDLWMYSGDTDGVVPITSTRYAINKLGTPVKTPWYPWYLHGEVGGYAVGYQNLTLVSIRGSGHFVPSYQPARALAFFSSFINGQLPPSS